MVAALQRDEPAVRDEGRQPAGLLDGDPGVAAGRAGRASGRTRALATSMTSTLWNASRNRTALLGDVVMPLQLVERLPLLGVPSGMNCMANTWRKAGVVGPQPRRTSCTRSRASSSACCVVARAQAPLGVRAVQDQAAAPVRGAARRRSMATGPPWEMPSSGNRSRPAASTTVSRSADPCVEREVVDVPVGQPAAPLVVADQPVAGRQVAPPVPPDRALPVVVEVGEPVGRLHQWRPVADRGVGEAHAVRRGAELDPLLVATVGARAAVDGDLGRRRTSSRRRRRSGSRGRARCGSPAGPCRRRRSPGGPP